MRKGRSESNVSEKFKSYVTGIMLRNFLPSNKIDKYFRVDLTESMSKAIEENWKRILGIDFDIISLNIAKNNDPLGIALEGRAIVNPDSNEIVNRHFLKVIRPNYCIGTTRQFNVGDELLEVNGLKIYGMYTKDVISALKKLPHYIQIVVARNQHFHDDCNSEGDDLRDMNGPISFYDMNEDISSRTCTLKSNSSLFSTTSRDFGSIVSVGDQIDGHHIRVSEYLRDIIGWRGPIVLEFRKDKRESLGLALEEISDPRSGDLIIVFKIIVPGMRAANDGRLHVGDRLLQVNGKPIENVKFSKVCQWMKSNPGGRLTLFICKPRFPILSIDTQDDFNDNYMYSTLARPEKLEMLSEDPDKATVEIPAVPETDETRLEIKRIDAKLGLFLEIVDGGKNGCRIRRMVNGQAKDNGVLQEGDYITTINGLNMRISEKNRLEHCLRIIAKSKSDYEIQFLRKEQVDMHNSKFMDENPINKGIYPDPSDIMNNDTCGMKMPCNSYDQPAPEKMSFETYYATVTNVMDLNLGLVLFPSLNDPVRYVAITDIHPDSLADKSKSLKINDELLTVNNKTLEGMTPTDVGICLKRLLQTEPELRFKIRRMIGAEDEVQPSGNNLCELTNQYPLLSDLPDMYFCILNKSHFGYGLSVKELGNQCGILINEIEAESSASNMQIIHPGHRFITINDNFVLETSRDNICKIIKNSKRSIALIMETPKFREFQVNVVKDASNSLGLNVGGGTDTKSPLAVIESIVLNTTCKFSESLRPDDFIVEVNEQTMVNLGHGQIIQHLKALPKENSFKIWRKIPFIKRDFKSIDSPSFIADYLQSCEFSVSINKPVSSISSFGIRFGDVVIADPRDYVVLERYKIVLAVEAGSLFEKYAPEVRPGCYVVSVNGSVIDPDMSCDQLRERIDSEDHITVLFARDVPYRADTILGYDEPVLIDRIGNDSNYSSISDQDQTTLAQSSESQNKRVRFNSHSTSTVDSVLVDIVEPYVADRGNGDVQHTESKEISIPSVKEEKALEPDSSMVEPSPIRDTNIAGVTAMLDESTSADDQDVSKEHEKPGKRFSCDEESILGGEITEIKNNSNPPTSLESDVSLKTENDVLNDILPKTRQIYEANENPVAFVSIDNIDNEGSTNAGMAEKDCSNDDQSSFKRNSLESSDILNISVAQGHHEDNPQDLSSTDQSSFKVEDPSNENLSDATTTSIDYESGLDKKEPPEDEEKDDANNRVKDHPEEINDINRDNDSLDLNVSEKNPCDTEGSFDDKGLPEDTEKDAGENTAKDLHIPTNSFFEIKDHPHEDPNHPGDTEDSLDKKVSSEDEAKDDSDGDSRAEDLAVLKDTSCDSDSENRLERQQLETDLGITIEDVVIPEIENVEIGFQVIGGVQGGPAGETLPIYVVGVERNSRVWPAGQDTPLLSNGTQLLELNGCNLDSSDLRGVERVIASTSGSLTFKVIKTK